MSPRSRSGWEEVYPLSCCLSARQSGESYAATVADSAYGMIISAGAPIRGWGAWWWVSNLGIVITTLGLSGSVRLGGVTGPHGDVWVGVAGIVGRGLRGGGVKRPPNRPIGGVVRKNSACAGVRRHVA